MDFVEICSVYVGKMIIKATKRIFNSDKIYRSYSDSNFGVTFLEHIVYVVTFFFTMLPSLKFAEEKVLVFFIFREKMLK